MDKKISQIHAFIKKQKIPLSYFVERTFYTRSHISAVLNGLKPTNPKFERLMAMAIKEFIATRAKTTPREDAEILHILEQ